MNIEMLLPRSPTLSTLLCLIFFIDTAQSIDCHNCTTAGNHWCGDQGSIVKCHANIIDCKTIVKNPLNCPRTPAAAFAYDETFSRTVVLPLVGAVYTHDPTICLRNQLPTTTFYKSIRVQCRNGGPNSTCHAYTAYDISRKMIMVSFEGTEGNQQWIDEISSFFIGKQPFFDSGNVFAYFFNAFYYLWNGGLESAIRSLKYTYPDFSLVAVGHSLGGSICTVFASHVVKVNLWSPDQVKLVTFGQPRTGDKAFAMWHDETFPYSYRIVHHKDPVPHVPPMGGKDEVFHHRYEVWYNNDMSLGQNYTVCQEADGLYCSNTQVDLEGDDHIHYYNTNLETWPSNNCPKQ